MPVKENQCMKIYEYLKEYGSITAAKAFLDLSVMRLAARISDLRGQGVEIDTEWQQTSTGSRYAVYVLKEKEASA